MRKSCFTTTNIMMAATLLLLLWVVSLYYRDTIIARTVPIGTLRAIAALPGRDDLMLETDSGYYDVTEPISIAKGASLFLITSALGLHRVCDAAPQPRCVRSTARLANEE